MIETRGFSDLPGSGDGADSAEAVPPDRLSRVPPEKALLPLLPRTIREQLPWEGPAHPQNHNAGGPQSARLSAQPRLLEGGVGRAQEAGKEGHRGEVTHFGI